VPCVRLDKTAKLERDTNKSIHSEAITDYQPGQTQEIGPPVTPDQVEREVRTRIEWGHSEQRIRTELIGHGAPAVTVAEALRVLTRAADSEYRLRGLAGMGLGATLLLAAYLLAAPVDSIVDTGRPDGVISLQAPGSNGHFLLASALFLVGMTALTVGGYRLLLGRKGQEIRHAS
jgi:hypothetical protein